MVSKKQGGVTSAKQSSIKQKHSANEEPKEKRTTNKPKNQKLKTNVKTKEDIIQYLQQVDSNSTISYNQLLMNIATNVKKPLEHIKTFFNNKKRYCKNENKSSTLLTAIQLLYILLENDIQDYNTRYTDCSLHGRFVDERRVKLLCKVCEDLDNTKQPFTSICNLSFLDHLKKVHKLEAPFDYPKIRFECPDDSCDTTCNTKKDLITHTNKIHNMKATFYDCGECGYLCLGEINMKEHYSSEHPENITDICYRCDQCEFVTKAYTAVRNHQFKHIDILTQQRVNMAFLGLERESTKRSIELNVTKTQLQRFLKSWCVYCGAELVRGFGYGIDRLFNEIRKYQLVDENNSLLIVPSCGACNGTKIKETAADFVRLALNVHYYNSGQKKSVSMTNLRWNNQVSVLTNTRHKLRIEITRLN